MLEITREPRTDGTVVLTAVVPADRADAVALAIEEVAGRNYAPEEVFPGSTPGSRLRGARGLKGMTQAALAAAVGIRASHVSDMEHGRRPIGKALAKKFGEVLGFPYRVFL